MNTHNLPMVKAESAYRAQQIRASIRVRRDRRSTASPRNDEGPRGGSTAARRWTHLLAAVRPVIGVHGR